MCFGERESPALPEQFPLDGGITMASSVPQNVPSRMAQNVAALFGHEDDTLLAWQRFCAQAAEALHAQHDPERLTKALALAQGGHVELEDDGFAVVTSGTKLYHVQADGRCDCPDAQHRGVPCKHVLAMLIHARAQELVAPSPSPAPPAATSNTPAPAPTKPTRQAKLRHSAAWDVHEAPVSSCFKIRVGALEWTHTMRASDDAELYTRVPAFVPTFREVIAALDALQAERDTAKAPPAPQPVAAPTAPTQLPAPANAPAQAPAPTKPTRQPKPRSSAVWDVHEAPASACFKW